VNGQFFYSPAAPLRQREIAVRAALGATRCRSSPSSDRKCRTVSDWRSLGRKSRVGLAQSDRRHDPAFHAALGSRLPLKPTSALLQSWRIDRCGSALRLCSGVANRAAQLSDTLKESGRSSSSSAGRHGLRRTLVVVEFALALTLLPRAGLVIHRFLEVRPAWISGSGKTNPHILSARHQRPLCHSRIKQRPFTVSSSIRSARPRNHAVSAPRHAHHRDKTLACLSTSRDRLLTIPRPSWRRLQYGHSRIFPHIWHSHDAMAARSPRRDAAGGVPVAVVNETL